MAFVTFDTYEHIENLKKAGVSHEMAKAIVDTVKVSHTELATKQDLTILEHVLKQDIANLRQDLVTTEQAIKKDMVIMEQGIRKDLELKISNFKADIIRWMVGLFFAQTALLLTLRKFGL